MYLFVLLLRSKLKRDSMLNELPEDEAAADLMLQQKEEEIRKMQDMLNQMQVIITLVNLSTSFCFSIIAITI